MIINDVEKITGLTKKCIRYYEEKGLIAPERLENDYRNYSEQDVQRLKKIKVYRYLGFSIKEVNDLLDAHQDGIQTILQNKVDEIEKQKEDQKCKQDLCLQLIKKPITDEVINKKIDEISFFESDEYLEFLNIADEESIPSLHGNIFFTLLLLGPVCWLIFNYVEKKFDMLWLNMIIAFISLRWMEGIWKSYYQYRRLNKEKVKTKNKSTSLLWLLFILLIVGGLGFMIGLQYFYSSFLMPDHYIFYQLSYLSEFFLIIATMLLVLVGISFLFGKFGINKIGEYNHLYAYVSKISTRMICPIVIVVIGLYYFALSNYAVVTDQTIIYHSSFHPHGITYNYNEVDSIDVYFKDGLMKYKVTCENHSFVFDQPTPKEDDYYDDTYIELEDFDRALVKLGVKKSSNLKGIEKVYMDDVYIKRFKRIANNT